MLLRYHGDGADTEIRICMDSLPWRRNFSRRDPRPFDHESVALSLSLPSLWKDLYKLEGLDLGFVRAQELCESRGGRPGLPSLISLRFLWT